MKSFVKYLMVVALLCFSIRYAVASDAPAKFEKPIVYGDFELKGGRLLSHTGQKNITSPGENIVQFTVSPDKKFIVFVAKERSGVSMWIMNVKSGKRTRVGRDIEIGCCVLADDIQSKGLDKELSFINGAFWTKTNEVFVRTLKGKGGAMDFFLSMKGELHGDI